MSLLQIVERELLTDIAAHTLRLARFAESRPNGPVDLVLDDSVSIRVERDRAFVEIAFTSTADVRWFNDAEVALWLGASAPPSTTGARESVAWLRALLVQHASAMVAAFEPSRWPTTKSDLLEIRRQRNNALAPPRPHG